MNNKENDLNIKNSEYINCNLKQKLLPVILKVEFNMIMDLLNDPKIFRIFFVREMHGIASSNFFSSKLIKDKCFFIIFPKKKGDILKIDDFLINKINNNNILDNYYMYNFKMIHFEQWEKHRKIILRFNLLNKDKNYNNNNNFINNNSDSKLSNYIDIKISLYLDINDNSTIIINEFLYDLNESEFSRFYDISNIYYQKLKIYFEKNLKFYFCNESALINRSMKQIFNYIMSLKIFHHERFEIKEIEKFNEEINIYVNIRDKNYPDSIYQAKCIILKLSDISSFVSILLLIDVNYFSLSKRFSYLKAAVIVVLKLLKKKDRKRNNGFLSNYFF